MTDPQIKPVTAWAVVDKKGKFEAWHVWSDFEMADSERVHHDRGASDRAPHRVIEVTITPKEKG